MRTLWVFPPGTGQILNYSLNRFDTDSLSVKYLSPTKQVPFESLKIFSIRMVFFCFVDCDRVLYMYDISRKSKIYIRNLSSLVQKYGVITGIVPFMKILSLISVLMD